ncbi:hypothetical protein [Marinobacter shengliensis]|uniref:hypothetical protein n=1 Tax=Marinobacter shengliensis TaxID=1389223 RepID=UPI001108EA64|nr:hypothetical protein [Marinobacter shengliensis]
MTQTNAVTVAEALNSVDAFQVVGLSPLLEAFEPFGDGISLRWHSDIGEEEVIIQSKDNPSAVFDPEGNIRVTDAQGEERVLKVFNFSKPETPSISLNDEAEARTVIIPDNFCSLTLRIKVETNEVYLAADHREIPVPAGSSLRNLIEHWGVIAGIRVEAPERTYPGPDLSRPEERHKLFFQKLDLDLGVASNQLGFVTKKRGGSESVTIISLELYISPKGEAEIFEEIVKRWLDSKESWSRNIRLGYLIRHLSNIEQDLLNTEPDDFSDDIPF